MALSAEVASTTREFDLREKARLYAANGVPEYRVADVPKRQIHQFWSPGIEGYAESDSCRFGERAEAVTIPGLAVETDGL